MKALVEELLKGLKQLPGFGLVVVLVTPIYTFGRGGSAEVSAVETVILAAGCFVLYRFGAVLDHVFDMIFGPKKQTNKSTQLPQSRLTTARNNCANALFNYINNTVVDYNTASTAGFAETHGLYKSAKAVARNSKTWDDSIGPLEEYSKFARTLAVIATLCFVALLLPNAVPNAETSIAAAATRLSILGRPVLHFAIAALSLFAYGWLRREHMIQLYEFVGRSVQHLDLSRGVGAIVVDVHFPPRTGA